MTNTIDPQPGDTVRVSFETKVLSDGYWSGRHITGATAEVTHRAIPAYRVGDIRRGVFTWIRESNGSWRTNFGSSISDSEMSSYDISAVGNVFDGLPSSVDLDGITRSLNDWVDEWGQIPCGSVDFYEAWNGINNILSDHR